MTKNKKFSFYGITSLLVLLGMLVLVVTSTAVGVAQALLTINKTISFTYEYDNHSFKCFTLENDDSGVAIALDEDASSTTAVTLNVPGTVTGVVGEGDPKTYTVKAIAEGAFRYTKFTAFNLPLSIEQVGAEAFAYCQNLINFDIPYKVTEIAPSMFLDCTALTKVYYNDNEGHRTYDNENITKIGDHAFDLCVSLQDFYCAKNITHFGQSCFQNCRSLVNFYFPSAIMNGNTITNPVKVEEYAFAYCTSLIFVYFETNVTEIDNYAFVDCNSALAMKYNGNSEPTFTKDGVAQPYWRRTNITTQIETNWPLEVKHPTIHSDPLYPCIRYTIESKVVKLDSADGRSQCTVKVIDTPDIPTGGYAVIYKFDLPTETVEGCFDVATGALTIPDTLGGQPVMIIRKSTFANNPTIKSVRFNSNLVQICNYAFYNCPNIEHLYFDECTHLKEVSFYAFQNYSIENKKLTSLMLPDCLEYIGDAGFVNFVNVNTFKLPENIKAIADNAFYGLGKNLTEGTVDLKLPKSLNDTSAAAANFKHFKSKGNFEHKNYTRWYAIGRYAFQEANCLRHVYMEEDPAHESDNSYSCSFFSNAFRTTLGLLSFRASSNAKYLGKDLFKESVNIREVFLTTAKAESTSVDYPWCINEEDGKYGGTFFSGSFPEVVVYVDGAKAPRNMENYALTADVSDMAVGHKWNAETGHSGTPYNNEIKSFIGKFGTSLLIRETVPTYYNVDFDGIVYWNPKTKAIADKPVTLADYNAGVVAFAKDTSNNYAVARYYYNSDHATGTIDLTQVPGVSATLTSIGAEAFAKAEDLGGDGKPNAGRDKAPGLYFILPDTITNISERAFFRKTNSTYGNVTNGRYGARVVTYKNSATGKYLDANGVSELTYDELEAKFTAINGQADVDKRGYCVLPSGVTSIGKCAFYNHIFGSIVLGSNITFMGAAAFYIHSNGSDGNYFGRNTVASISMGTNSLFEVSSNYGMYYIGSGNSKKMLLYQANNITGTLEIEENTKAIAFEGCANTKYTTIKLPSGLTTIYGAGLYGNIPLTTITGTSSLRYIGAMENANRKASSPAWSDDGYEEVYDDSLLTKFGITDYRAFPYQPRYDIEALFGAVANCRNLTTMDFTVMTQLRKIGRNAFDNDAKLEYMTGSNTYTFSNYNASTKTITPITNWENVNKGVLDLSNCSNLRSIERNAFNNCSKIKYAIIPNNRGSASESPLFIGFDPETTFVDGTNGSIFNGSSTNILVSESALYAHHDYGKDNKAQNHYKANCFGSNNKVYYYVGSSSDIPGSDHTSLKYWTKVGNNYILINSADNARVYFSAQKEGAK